MSDATRWAWIAYLAAVGLLLGGCATAPHAGGPDPVAGVAGPDTTVRPGLVLPGRTLISMGDGLDRGWEQGRNDARLGRPAPTLPVYDQVVEIHSRQHLRIINGRPRENTTQTTRSWQRGATR